jgi:hypothetical protein
LTDPLTGKELVEKSYEYIEKLTRECAKSLVDEFNKGHRKFDSKTFSNEVGSAIILWFNKRDKNIKLNVDSTNAAQQQPNMAHIRFKGSTKDADFEISSTVGTFSVPMSDGKTMTFVKTLVFSVEKNSFHRRKV